MIILKNGEKEFKLVPRTRKVIELTEKLKGKSLSDLIFNGYKNADIKILVEIIKAFAEDEDGKAMFLSAGTVCDFIDNWVIENNKSYNELYREVIEVTNEMGFLKEKKTEENLKEEMDNPFTNIDMNEIIENSAQKAIESIAQEEFKGYKG